MGKVLVLGGYGNFGWRISERLVKSGVQVVIAGRNPQKAEALAVKLGAEFAVFDVNTELAGQLEKLKPKVVVNTCGPFQNADYSVAKTCIRQSVHYIDLADGRDFVCGISELDEAARQAGVFIISGASTVPGLSSAVMEKYKDEFSEIESLTYGITPGQKASRGLATTKGILSYLGKPLKPTAGHKQRYGWQDIYQQDYPELGRRWMANCDIPDLDLFPGRYGLKSIQFSAGMENTFLHFGIWATSWLVRAGLPVKLENHAATLLKMSHWFDSFGSADGGMHMIIKGRGKNGGLLEKKWFIIAKHGDGPYIPCVPAIILARKLSAGSLPGTGAQPCVGLVKLDEYLAELQDFWIRDYEL